MREKIERGRRLWTRLRRTGRDPRKAVETIYLTTLSRRPTAEEWRILQQFSSDRRWRGRRALIDLVWALINTVEFQYRH